MTLETTQLLETPQPHRFTREEYYQMADAGVFRQGFGEMRVELIDGEILPKNSEIDPPPPVRFDRIQYDLMAEAGIFAGRRVELIDGEIFEMAPMKDLHAVAMGVVREALMRAFPDCWVRDQLPLPTAENAEPAPDFAVVAGKPRDHKGQGHPRNALLVVEVSDTTLRFDRGKKATAYARAGIRDYWIVNLVNNCVELMRDPAEDPSVPAGWRYRSVKTIGREGAVSPVARPKASIPVVDLLP